MYLYDPLLGVPIGRTACTVADLLWIVRKAGTEFQAGLNGPSLSMGWTIVHNHPCLLRTEYLQEALSRRSRQSFFRGAVDFCRKLAGKKNWDNFQDSSSELGVLELVRWTATGYDKRSLTVRHA